MNLKKIGKLFTSKFVGTGPSSYEKKEFTASRSHKGWETVLHANHKDRVIRQKEGALDVNPLTPKDPYKGRTAPLTSKRFILCIYLTNIDSEYFKHDTYSLRSFLFKMQFVS